MSNREPDIYIYKMVADNGGAPCVAAGLLSLAICKPMIRKSAAKGSLIFGFGGKAYLPDCKIASGVAQVHLPAFPRSVFWNWSAFAMSRECKRDSFHLF